MRNEERLAREILEQLGGAGNIADVASCMTRLRVKPTDYSKVDIAGIKKIDGVLGVVEEETLQIILGPGIVTKVANEVSEITGKTASLVDESDPDPFEGLAGRTKDDLNKKNATPFKLFLRRIASIFIPLIPAIVASGLIAGITNVIIRSGADPESTFIQFLNLIGWGIFSYLGVFVGINTAREFGGSPALGGAAGILIINPGLANITLFGEALVPGRGGLIGVMLAAVFIAMLEKRIRKFVPSSLDIIITPTLSLLITGIATLFVLQPVGGLISDLITKGLLGLLDVGGILAGLVLAGTFLPLVVTGLHQGLTPVHMELINTIGDDPLLPILAMGGAGQVGAAFAIYFKTKNEKLKKVIKGGLPVGMLGIGEPLIFGVTLPLGRPFITACLGAAVGGAFQAFFKIATIAIGVSGIPLAFLVHTNQILIYLLGLLIAYVFGFIFTWTFGFKEEMAKGI
ncbi:PTS transporter subunit EIIC [Mesobacillus selenatarsenatis]|uniref:PTS system, N-acetylmuramic acid-specific IIB component /PTS system, N-acetylmuramic acid-specific IIC component n=1 Tax=Mesobacillus selenatarsenatis (strain DSM 18680 / JCM 14380 / FERM P-15431 / SF-1) TaxID=1321606 RepID=A0A0A8X968_MESS1|nr:PTS transporter subunit EIIC [Mesobacillus selenatarsenatis]GAM15819.1 PTS system, N-acetylmuramic acid-specific IIB component /PTS system, N-acetylmuramic acid-specific IIC component [Mesobacillus selenatarsenatis SF-1]